MSFAANVLRVIVASPSDVAEERRIVAEELHRWNAANATARKLVLLPVRWETHSSPQMDGPAQSDINKRLLRDADILVGILATRIGTATGEYASGTVEEIKRHVAERKAAMIYFSKIPVEPQKLDRSQFEQVETFRADIERGQGTYWTFSSHEEFRRFFSHHLDVELNKTEYLWLKVPEMLKEEPQQISDDGKRVLLMDT